MKKKYLGLLLLGASCMTGALAVDAYQSAKGGGRDSGAMADGQLRTMDAKLADHVKEQMELINMVQALMDGDLRKRAADLLQSREANPLAGKAQPIVPPLKPSAAAPVAPWWSSAKVSMVYFTEGDHYVVINGQMLKEGQPLTGSPGVTIQNINQNTVTLRKGKESHVLLVDKS